MTEPKDREPEDYPENRKRTGYPPEVHPQSNGDDGEEGTSEASYDPDGGSGLGRPSTTNRLGKSRAGTSKIALTPRASKY